MTSSEGLLNQKQDEKFSLFLLFLALFVVYLTIILFTGLWPWQDNPHNGYARQAEAWLHGRLDISEIYDPLQVASFQGKSFFSFPPTPSIFILPFITIFGSTHSPDHLLTLMASIAGAWLTFKLGRRFGKSPNESAFWAFYITVASNLLFISMRGWVWYMAQTFSFTLTLAAIYLAATPRFRDGYYSSVCFGLALGCRPFQILFLPILIWFLWQKPIEKPQKFWNIVLWVLPTIAICFAYAGLNLWRFNNPLEFGHSYLPEFALTSLGQFNIAYLPQNLSQLLALPGIVDGKLHFPIVLGFAFFLSSPIFISFVVHWLAGIWKFKEGRKFPLLILPVTLILFTLLVACHKTLGGRQFGCRYFVDILPLALIGVYLIPLSQKIKKYMWPIHFSLLGFGLLFNFAGTIAFFNGWI